MNYINNSALCLLYDDQIYIIPLQACDKRMFPRIGNNVCQSTTLIWVLHKIIKHPQKKKNKKKIQSSFRNDSCDIVPISNNRSVFNFTQLQGMLSALFTTGINVECGRELLNLCETASTWLLTIALMVSSQSGRSRGWMLLASSGTISSSSGCRPGLRPLRGEGRGWDI